MAKSDCGKKPKTGYSRAAADGWERTFGSKRPVAVVCGRRAGKTTETPSLKRSIPAILKRGHS